MTDASSTTTTPGAGSQDPQGAPVGTPGTQPQGDAATAPQAPQAPAQTATPDAPVNTATGKPWTLDEALSAIKSLREENASKRTAPKRDVQTALRAVAEAAGIELPDDAPTVETLSRDLQARQVDLDRASDRASKAEADAAIARAAWAAGIPAEREKYLAFVLADDAEVQAARGTERFGATITAKIASLAGSDPMLKGNAGSGGRASGPDTHGGANGSSAITPEQFEAMSYDERLDLFQKNPEEYRRLSAA